MTEKRTHCRKSLEVEAWIADVLSNTWSPVRLMDLSIGGAALIASEALSAGSTRMLRFTLPDNPERLVFTAKVVHCAEHTFLAGYRIGVEFIRRDAHALEILAQFIKDADQDSPL